MDKTKSIISGVEYLENKNSMTPKEKRKSLYQKNLKKLGFILLNCSLLKTSSKKTDLNNRNREYLEDQIEQLKKVYEFDKEPGIKVSIHEKKKSSLIDLIRNLILMEEKKLILDDIKNHYFFSGKMIERYTHNAF